MQASSSSVAVHPITLLAALMAALGVGGLLLWLAQRWAAQRDKRIDGQASVRIKQIDDDASERASFREEIKALRVEVKAACDKADKADADYVKLEARYTILESRYDFMINQYSLLYAAYRRLRAMVAHEDISDLIEPLPPNMLNFGRRSTDPPMPTEVAAVVQTTTVLKPVDSSNLAAQGVSKE
jgi:hypothetical protein